MDCNLKIKDRFNAFERHNGRAALYPPFTVIGINTSRVDALDANGVERVFDIRVWRIEKLDGEQKKKGGRKKTRSKKNESQIETVKNNRGIAGLRDTAGGKDTC